MSQQGNQKLELTAYSTDKHGVLGFRYQVVLICCTVLYLFYPSIYGEICLLDDREMLNAYSFVEHFDLKGTFFPQSREGLYYRPMIGVSFWMDRFLWNLDPAIMHLENILLHLTSSLLIFLIARLIISKTSTLPLFAALIFAVHPIATESVNWISGRTDLLAVTFVLVSLYSMFCFRQTMRPWWLVTALVTLILSALTKETAVGYIPALFFILSSKRTAVTQADELNSQQQSLFTFLMACILSLSAALLFFNHYLSIAFALLYFFYLLWCRRGSANDASFWKYLVLLFGTAISLWTLYWGIRELAFSSQSPHISRTLGLLFTDMNHTLSLFFRGSGFYVKKFIYPFPLNFVIRDVSPYYTLVGVMLLCLVAVLVVRRRLSDSLVIAGFWMIAPVLPLTFESIAWTSYAERYVYPAAPFWILAIVGYLSSAGFDRFPDRIHKVCVAGLSLLIIVMAASTFQRNIVWQTNIALFEDTVKKTADYKPVRGLYMSALFEKGFYDLALQQFHVAQSIPIIEFKYNSNYDLFYVYLLIAKKQFAKAELELDRINKKTKGKDPAVYEAYLEFAPQIIINAANISEKKRIAELLLMSYDKLYTLTNDPMLLYRKGQFLLLLNREDAARKMFESAAIAFPEKSSYKKYSEKLARR